VKPFVDQALSGEGTWSEDFPLTMMRNGYPEETHWTFSYSPLYDDDQITGMINIALETTQSVIARRNQSALQHELMHRAKNNLAVTTAVVSSTLRYATSLDAARETVAARISALSKAQDMLRANESEASISEIVTVALRGPPRSPRPDDDHGRRSQDHFGEGDRSVARHLRTRHERREVWRTFERVRACRCLLGRGNERAVRVYLARERRAAGVRANPYRVWVTAHQQRCAQLFRIGRNTL